MSMVNDVCSHDVVFAWWISLDQLSGSRSELGWMSGNAMILRPATRFQLLLRLERYYGWRGRCDPLSRRGLSGYPVLQHSRSRAPG